MPNKCLPEHLKGKLHDDWPWPFKYIPRAWSAFCGQGPVWKQGKNYEPKPIPQPGYRSAHWKDLNGSFRPYWSVTFKNGWHIRQGFRWDDVDLYYNFVVISMGREYDS